MERKISNNGNKLIVSEFVSFGHPDKIADQIADAILDSFLVQDKNARTGIEVMVKDNTVVLGGEVNSTAKVDYESVVREVYSNINFPDNHHLSPQEIKVINLIGKQSEEIHSGVDKEESIGAGDQGFMVGLATNETSLYMPLGHYIAKEICNHVSKLDQLGPDTKTQVIVEYDENNNALGIHSILVSTMHQCSIENVRCTVNNAITENLVGLDSNIYDTFIKDKEIKIVINPCGSWQIGGPISDCGVTGRKLVVDSYGGYCNIGGGAYCGKDLSKVDRSGAYMARYLAKNIVASGFCDTCRVTLSYMIGVEQPCSLEIDVNRNVKKLPYLKKWIVNNVDLTPKSFIKRFVSDVKDQFYQTSRYGHFGHNAEATESQMVYPWEKLDLVEDLKDYIENHEYVDLGLPSGTLWAKCNVGAEKETDNGLYFAWGETEGHKDTSDKAFSWNDYKFETWDSLTKYNEEDGKTTLDLEDDAAHVNMGGDWHMPTREQCEELFYYTEYVTNEWVENYNNSGINGRLFTSKTNGNTLFIPAAGSCEDGSVYNVGSVGSVWASSLNSDNVNGAWDFFFGGSVASVYGGGRCIGQSVRGVINH